MGTAKVSDKSRNDFEWVYTEEPHASRRRAILKKYPEIKKLFGAEPRFKWIVSGMVLAQIISAYLVRDASWTVLLFLAYFWGGVINHSLSLAIHEISHNIAFGQARPFANRVFGIWANLPLGVPMSIAFKKYHIDHHRLQAVDTWDVDLPTEWEGRFFRTPFRKFIWLALQPLFYSIRPLFVRPKPVSKLEVSNIAAQLVFDALIFYFFGFRSIFYLVGGTLLSMGIHPIAGHFISEHYMFVKGYETYSYYGILNCITFNVGYHTEHHDLPFVAYSKLPEVKRIASEFYDDLPQHTSWVRVLYDFVMDPQMGPYARIKRKESKPTDTQTHTEKSGENTEERARISFTG